jgi:multimeric flavodoxin WrbA
VGARRPERQGRRGLLLDRTQHGGQETTLFSIITNLLHFGMVVVGLPYSFAGQMTLDEIVGGSPYGATTIAGTQGQRQPSSRPGRRAPPGRAGGEDGGFLHRFYKLFG